MKPALTQKPEEVALTRRVEDSPSESSPTHQDFVRQYAQAIDHMMATKGVRLHLPKDFMARWAACPRPPTKEKNLHMTRVEKWLATQVTKNGLTWQDALCFVVVGAFIVYMFVQRH